MPAHPVRPPGRGGIPHRVDADTHRSGEVSPDRMSRRSVVATMLAVLAPAAGTAVALPQVLAIAAAAPAIATAPEHPDRKLLELAVEYDRLLAIEDAAYERFDACCDASNGPKTPPALLHTKEDRRLGLHISLKDNIKIGEAYDGEHIRRIKHAPPAWQVHLIGLQKARIAEIVLAQEGWLTAWRDADEAAGVYAAEAAREAATEAREAVADQIAGLQASTLAGLRARAKIIEKIYDGDLSGDHLDDRTTDIKLMWSIVRDLANMSA